MNTHCPSEHHEIRILHYRMRVPPLIEKVLPLLDHALELVVEDKGLDADVKLSSGGELHSCHAERSISVNVDDGFVGLCNFSPNGGWETEAHGLRADEGSLYVGRIYKKSHPQSTRSNH